MNKTLAFVGFLAGMSNVFGMDISTEKPEFECYDGEWRVTCRNMSTEDLKKRIDELDCAIYVTFENCDLSDGVFCTSADSLTFKKCYPIRSRRDVLYYVGLGDFPNDVSIKIEN